MSGDEPTGKRWRRYRGKRALARVKALNARGIEWDTEANHEKVTVLARAHPRCGANVEDHSRDPLVPSLTGAPPIVDTDIGDYLDDGFALGVAARHVPVTTVHPVVPACADTGARSRVSARWRVCCPPS